MINLNIGQLIILIIAIILIIWILYMYSKPSKCVSHLEKYETISQKNKVYYFYSPFCIHCKKFTATWNELVKNIKDFEFNAIDATLKENQNLAFYYNVNKFPTIILALPNKTIEYSGDRSYNDILNFINKKNN